VLQVVERSALKQAGHCAVLVKSFKLRGKSTRPAAAITSSLEVAICRPLSVVLTIQGSVSAARPSSTLHRAASAR